MQDIRLALSRLTIIGMVIAIILIVSGGIFNLIQHHQEVIRYQNFHGYAYTFHSFAALITNPSTSTPRTIIEFGLYILFITQIARVVVILLYFCKSKDKLFVIICLFILCILLLSMFATT
jgi:uncharacterized membrane protein